MYAPAVLLPYKTCTSTFCSTYRSSYDYHLLLLPLRYILQVDLYGGTNTVSGVVTQGSPTSHEWVSSFKVRVGVVECDLRYIVDSDDATVVST